MDLYLVLGAQGEILKYSTHEFENEDFVLVENNIGEEFFDDTESYFYRDGQLVFDSDKQLSLAKSRKIEELRASCQESIEKGFYHTFDSIEYWFSLDMEAQQNFSSTYQIMKDGLIQDVMWTVKADNEYTRININKTMMEELALAILLHKTNNIAKFRDILSPLVAQASTLEEVNSINW